MNFETSNENSILAWLATTGVNVMDPLLLFALAAPARTPARRSLWEQAKQTAMANAGESWTTMTEDEREALQQQYMDELDRQLRAIAARLPELLRTTYRTLALILDSDVAARTRMHELINEIAM